MSNEDKIKDLVTSIGAMTEMLYEFYRQLMERGFTSKQALELTQTWLAITFKPQPKPFNPEDMQ